MKVSLSLTGDQHGKLRRHLLHPDGKEAAAFILCGRRAGIHSHRLLGQEVFLIPHEDCTVRSPVRVSYPTDLIVPLLEKASKWGLTLVKVHSHPSGLGEFSETDDEGDLALLPAIKDWIEDETLKHCSMVMLPDGKLFGRYFDGEGSFVPLDEVHVVSDDLVIWRKRPAGEVADFAASHVQAFGEQTFADLATLSVAVVGCSGTGSPLVEQLARLGIQRLVLVDDDAVERRNLNRIYNATARDAEKRVLKVDMMAEAVGRIGLGTEVVPIGKSLWDPVAVKAVAECDFLFGCMDTVDGRFLLNLISSCYLIPYIDIGVRLDATGKGGSIRAACGGIHYIQPSGSSLLSRGLVDMEAVRAAGLARRDPGAHRRQLDEGYITGGQGQRPAVISLNSQLASMAVNELIARLNPFRDEPNSHYDHVQLDFAGMEIIMDSYPVPCPLFRSDVGMGDHEPLLGLTEMSRRMA